ncbi:polyprotein [Cucumis melo var. makuwa]|uniref:Polyprotein n=1 Tax=Cucumis melo var. makuwa TaxID=1194695 RepID=A0A5A7SLK0_CUCMM|nr:polyprotein [Cucumis melo var. makuwa]
MTYRGEWFHNYKPVSGGSVFACNDHALKIFDIGTIKLKLHDNTVCTIQQVRHVEGLKKNLLSLGQLDDLDCKVVVEKRLMKVIQGALVLMKGRKVDANLYMLEGEILQEGQASVASSSSGGARYFVSFKDNYSKRCWVYPIKKKANVCLVFKVFKVQVELQSGIKRQFTTAYTPQQNGVVEWVSRTLLERTRAMLGASGLKKAFCAEAVNTACYIVNRYPSTAIELKAPMQMWTGKLADYSNLNIFESPIYERYNDPTVHKVIISVDIIFMKDKKQVADDSIVIEILETATVHVETESVDDSSEAEPMHENQEPVEQQVLEICRSSQTTRPLGWQSKYINVAYYLLTEDGEPLTLKEAMASSDDAQWMTTMQEKIEALHKNKT